MPFNEKDWQKVAKSVEDIIKTDSKTPTDSMFSAPYSTQQSAAKVNYSLIKQKPWQRTVLLLFVCLITTLSFILLAYIVIHQMNIRVKNPSYNGVSDTVINILTGGVFGQSIAVVAVIASYVWRDPK